MKNYILINPLSIENKLTEETAAERFRQRQAAAKEKAKNVSKSEAEERGWLYLENPPYTNLKVSTGALSVIRNIIKAKSALKKAEEGGDEIAITQARLDVEVEEEEYKKHLEELKFRAGLASGEAQDKLNNAIESIKSAYSSIEKEVKKDLEKLKDDPTKPDPVVVTDPESDIDFGEIVDLFIEYITGPDLELTFSDLFDPTNDFESGKGVIRMFLRTDTGKSAITSVTKAFGGDPDNENDRRKAASYIQTGLAAAIVAGYGQKGFKAGFSFSKDAFARAKDVDDKAAKGITKAVGERVSDQMDELPFGKQIKNLFSSGDKKSVGVLTAFFRFLHKGSFSTGAILGMLTEIVTRNIGDFINQKKNLKKLAEKLAADQKREREAAQKAFDALPDLEKIERQIQEALKEGDLNKAKSLADNALSQDLIPLRSLDIDVGTLVTSGQKQVKFIFKEIADGLVVREKTIAQDFALKAADELEKAFKRAKKTAPFARRLEESQSPNNVVSEQENPANAKLISNSLKVFVSKVAGEDVEDLDKVKEILKSAAEDGSFDSIVEFVISKAALEEYAKSKSIQVKNLENMAIALNQLVEKLEQESKNAGQQTSPDAPATAAPQTQTPVSESKIKISKSKLIDLISDQVKEQTQTIEVDKAQLIAFIVEEACKQISRKK